MCGIAGYFGKFKPEVLELANTKQIHRGPDSGATWYDANAGIGLAHRRLAIIDLSPAGHQPMLDNTGDLVIVLNGEIYNYRELRERLKAGGYAFKGHSDTEVVLALYKAHGQAMLGMLNGIFAFAIYNRADKTLFVACDCLAVKPLYFANTSEGFIFASELKALLAFEDLDKTLDADSLFRTLGFLWSPGGNTPFKSVKRLGPGEALIVREGCIAKRWQWAESAWQTTPQNILPADAVSQVREALRTAVHRQMVADVPVGAFLSGGLDSSAVVALAREVSPGIDCFTINTGKSLDAGVTDDLPYAQKAARHLGVKLHEIKVDSSSMAADLERMVFQLDEPLADPAPLNVLYISQLARQTGIKVLLSGAGGDDLFTGYRRHRALMAERYWSGLPTAVRAGMRHLSAGLGQGGALRRRVAKALAHADQPAEDRLLGYFLWADPARVLGLFSPQYRDSLSVSSMTAPLKDYLAGLPRGMAPLQQMLALEQRFFLADHNLLYTDKMSMAAGVETRVPFLDNDLVRLANSLPPGLKQNGAEGKWVLKKAMEPYLPKEIIYRPKTGFGVPLRHWLRNELKELVNDTLSRDTLSKRGLFDPVAVEKLLNDDRAGRIDAAYTVLGLLCIEIWCRKNLG